MQNIEKNLNQVQQQIELAAKEHNREPSEVSLLAVSKRKPVEDIRAAYVCGQRDFGENYLQEAQEKIAALADLDIHWHFIGAIQSNKTRPIATSFDWAHCIDRFKIASRLSEHRSDALEPLNVCIQVNIDAENSKAGVTLAEVPELAARIAALPNIRLRGLMAIPAPRDDIESQRKPFALLADMFQKLNQQGLDCDTLSIGMSHDISAAIAEGATLVRIGTAIFGERP